MVLEEEFAGSEKSPTELFASSGYLSYEIDKKTGYKLTLSVDKDIRNYYRWLLPKYISGDLAAKPHISIVRKSTPPKLEFWGERVVENPTEFKIAQKLVDNYA